MFCNYRPKIRIFSDVYAIYKVWRALSIITGVYQAVQYYQMPYSCMKYRKPNKPQASALSQRKYIYLSAFFNYGMGNKKRRIFPVFSGSISWPVINITKPRPPLLSFFKFSPDWKTNQEEDFIGWIKGFLYRRNLERRRTFPVFNGLMICQEHSAPIFFSVLIHPNETI